MLKTDAGGKGYSGVPTFEQLSPEQVRQLVRGRGRSTDRSAADHVGQLPLPVLRRQRSGEITVPPDIGTFTSYLRFVSVELTENRRRFYLAEWQPLLWGGGALVRTWGRIGALGLTGRVEYPDRPSAQTDIERLIRRRLARGYTLIEWS